MKSKHCIACGRLRSCSVSSAIGAKEKAGRVDRGPACGASPRATSWREWMQCSELESPSRFSRSWQLPRLTSDAERFYCDATETLPSGSGVVLIARPHAMPLIRLRTPCGKRDSPRSGSHITQGLQCIGGEPRPLKDSVAKTRLSWRTTSNRRIDLGCNSREWGRVASDSQHFAAFNSTSTLLITLGFPRNEDSRLARGTVRGKFWDVPTGSPCWPSPIGWPNCAGAGRI